MSIFLILFIMFVIVVASMWLKKKPAQPEKIKAVYQYEKKQYFISRSEHEFFMILQQEFGTNYYIFPQVHLSKIIEHKVKGQNWDAAFKHINGKSVDYVICDKQNIQPLVAIELDGSSHQIQDRIERDGIVENILKQANMPLVRIERKDSYGREEVVRVIAPVLDPSGRAS